MVQFDSRKARQCDIENEAIKLTVGVSTQKRFRRIEGRYFESTHPQQSRDRLIYTRIVFNYGDGWQPIRNWRGFEDTFNGRIARWISHVN